MLSFIHALLRVRRQLCKGRHFYNVQDMVMHFRRLIEHPWLAWLSVSRCKRERRAARVSPSLRASAGIAR